MTDESNVVTSSWVHNTRDRAHKAHRCAAPPIGCGKVVELAVDPNRHKGTTPFRDGLSLKEYGISALCQDCQDAFFGGPDDVPMVD